MIDLSPEVEELVSSSFTLRRILSPVLPPQAVDYICELIAKDGAHRKFLKLTSEENQVD